MLGASAGGQNMQDQVSWVILHRYIDGLPWEFLEIHRNKHRIWFSRGRIRTFGQDEIEVHRTGTRALARYQAILVAGQAEGFIVSAEGQYRSGSFDFEAFKSALRASTLRCLADMPAKHAGETICGFAYLTDDDVMTISCMVNTQEWIAQETDPDLKDEVRFNVSAWAHDDGGEWIDVPYRMLVWQSRLRGQAASLPKLLDNITGKAIFEKPQPIKSFRRAIFEALVETLCQLRKEGVFDEFGEDFALLVQVADSEQIPEMVTRLNSDRAFIAGYRAFVGPD